MTAASDIEYASLGRRYVAFLLDLWIVYAVIFAAAISIGLRGGAEDWGDAEFQGLAILLFAAYFVVAEATAGATAGKRVLGLRVLHDDGDRIGFGAALLRNALRIIDGLFLGLVGFILASMSTERKRLGDRAADTIVVRLPRIADPIGSGSRGRRWAAGLFFAGLGLISVGMIGIIDASDSAAAGQVPKVL